MTYRTSEIKILASILEGGKASPASATCVSHLLLEQYGNLPKVMNAPMSVLQNVCHTPKKYICNLALHQTEQLEKYRLAIMA